MTETTAYRGSLRRLSVSETDVPTDRAESNPNLLISGFIDESPFAGPGTCLQSRREGVESRTNKISDQLENLRLKIYEWTDRMKILGCPNDEFQSQFTTFSNAINELTMLALMNRVPIPISRDISGLNDIIIKCKHDRLKNLDPWNNRPALRSELNVSVIVPLTHGGSDPSIRRGNLRPMGNPLYNSVNHYTRGVIYNEFLCSGEEV